MLRQKTARQWLKGATAKHLKPKLSTKKLRSKRLDKSKKFLNDSYIYQMIKDKNSKRVN